MGGANGKQQQPEGEEKRKSLPSKGASEKEEAEGDEEEAAGLGN